MSSSLLLKKLPELQGKILKLAHERLLQKEDLSFGEILITLYGCRPKRIGPQIVQKLSRDERLALCRLDPGQDFYFVDKKEENKYHLAGASASKAVADLVKKGLLITTKSQKLIWAKDQPRVKRIEDYEMIRLTEEGEKILTTKSHYYRHSLFLPTAYHLPDLQQAICQSSSQIDPSLLSWM